MKLLITTQKVDKDDPILGFFHEWIIEFSKHFEHVTVVCLYEGSHQLPENVKVLSLGKEHGISRVKYIFNFYKYIWKERRDYDTVFVHMNQMYVVLGGIFWIFSGKKIGLWYVHRAVSLSLRAATLLVDDVYTATKQGFNLSSSKVHVIGHGIDTNLFLKKEEYAHDTFTIISVSRITRIKNLETLIDAASLVHKRGYNLLYQVIGPRVTTDDAVYYEELKKYIHEKGLEKTFVIRDPATNKELPEYFWRSDININLSPTGGMDKAVLEGIAGGCIPLASNLAFEDLFGDYASKLIFKFHNAQDLAEKIIEIFNDTNKSQIISTLQKKVMNEYALSRLITKITSEIMDEGKVTVSEKYWHVFRYIVSGGSAAIVDITLLYMCTSIFGWWYLISAIVAFLVAFVVSFLLQKFWTFQDHATHKLHSQASLFFIVSLVNLGINTLLMYIFVDFLHIWYIFSQILVAGLIAISSFFIYRNFIFNSK